MHALESPASGEYLVYHASRSPGAAGSPCPRCYDGTRIASRELGTRSLAGAANSAREGVSPGRAHFYRPILRRNKIRLGRENLGRGVHEGLAALTDGGVGNSQPDRPLAATSPQVLCSTSRVVRVPGFVWDYSPCGRSCRDSRGWRGLSAAAKSIGSDLTASRGAG